MKHVLMMLSLATLVACGAPEVPNMVERLKLPTEYDKSKIQGEVTDNWVASFQDKELTRYVNLAIQNNKDLRSSYYQMRAAETQAKLAGADIYPKLSISANENRELFNSVRSTGSNQANNTFFTNFSGRRKTTGVSLNLSWELDLWGRLRSQKNAARAEYEASRDDYYAARLSLVAQVTKAYYATVEAAEQLRLGQALYALQQRKTRFMTSRHDKGVVTSRELRMALSEQSALEANAIQAVKFYDQAQRQLEILLGNYPHLKEIKTKSLPLMAGAVPAGLPSELLARRPDLSAARYRLLSSGFKVSQSKAELLPSLSLTGSGGGRSHDFKYVTTPSSRVWSVAGNLTQPLFEGGRLREQLTLSEKQQALAMAQYESVVLKAFAEVEIALMGDEYLQLIETRRRQEYDAFTAILKTSNQKYKEGQESLNELIEHEKNQLNKKSNWIRAKRELLDNRVDLHLALGGGWSRHEY